MSSKTPIFLTGATGYIGGAVASLPNHPNSNTFEITVLIRSPEKAKILNDKFGVKAVVASHAELDMIEKLAEDCHVIFHLADADDVPLIDVILKGLKSRHDKLGDLPILIHMSGTGLLSDNAPGKFASDIIYNDLNVAQIKSIPPAAFHHNVDLRVIDADEQGYVRTYIVLPSTIYGIASHVLVEACVSNPHSRQIPTLITASLDPVELYMVLFDNIVANPDKTGHGWEGFYFGENGEHHWLDISKAIGQAMTELGLSDSPEPTAFTVDELKKYYRSEWKGWYNGSNSRARADRGRALGWKPKYTMQDMLASIKPEVELYAKKQ